MSGPRIVAAAGLGLSVVMIVLLGIGTTHRATFILWIVLMLAGGVIFFAARKVDETNRRRQQDEDFRRRSQR